MSRRHAIKAGALGLGGVGFALLTGTTGGAPTAIAANAATPPPSPQVLQSVNGVLQGTLRVTADPAWVAGDPASGTMTYNGLYPGPVLRVKPGDRVLLDVVNELDQMINTHFHGLHVTPSGTGDNVFATVDPGQTFHHDFVIPADHPGGLYWYHPHMHGLVDAQLFAGLAGLLVVEGGAAALPELAGRKAVLLALKNSYLTGVAPDRVLAPEPEANQQIQLVNGELQPTLTIAPGETQLWQIANIGNDAYYRIALDGHTMTVLAEDGALLWDTYTATELLMPPGKRYEVAVTGGTPGPYAFRQLGYTQGPFGEWPAVVLADVEVTGAPQVPASLPAHPVPRADLSDQPIAQHRTIVMSEGFEPPNNPLFFMNGVLFQNIVAADIVNVELGTTEEWVIRNDPSLPNGTPEDHPFHIHVNPFVVTGRGTWDATTNQVLTYEAVDPKGTQDTLNVKAGEYAVIRMQFADFTGKSVFHCHITFHEDHGMMGIFQIAEPPPASTTTTTAAPTTTTTTPAAPPDPVVVQPVFTG